MLLCYKSHAQRLWKVFKTTVVLLKAHDVSLLCNAFLYRKLLERNRLMRTLSGFSNAVGIIGLQGEIAVRLTAERCYMNNTDLSS